MLLNQFVNARQPGVLLQHALDGGIVQRGRGDGGRGARYYQALGVSGANIAVLAHGRGGAGRCGSGLLGFWNSRCGSCFSIFHVWSILSSVMK